MPFCKVRAGRKDVIIPKDSTIAVSSHANTGPVNKQTPVLFEPDKLAQLPEGLEVNEILLNIKPGKTSKVQVAVYNGTDHEVVLKSCTLLGVLQAVKSVTAADVRLSNCGTLCDHHHLKQHEPQKSTKSTLPGQQDKEGKNLSRELISVAWLLTSEL